MNKVLLVLGIALLIFPVGSRILESRKQQDLLATYEEKIKEVEVDSVRESMERARAYNLRLYTEGWIQEEEYGKQLNFLEGEGAEDGVMGSLEIPKINLKLPIRHGITEAVLATSVGHMKESSLPVGGENTHSVLSGHRGVPSAELFTRLDELERGDMFYVRVCNEKLCYQICEIQTVNPEDTEVVAIQDGRDLVSLVTCTPYGLNTHRLIVTGERFYEESMVVSHNDTASVSKWDAMACGIVLVTLVIFFAKTLRKKYDRKEKQNEKMLNSVDDRHTMRLSDGGTRCKRKH